MTRKQSLFFLLAAWFVCGSVSLSVAGEPPLASFAADADVVIRLRSPKQTIEKTATMAGTASEKLAEQVRHNSPFIGVLISNPALAGVDQEQDWLVVVHAHADADPAVIFCIPASDESAMQSALPEKMTAFARDGWVYYSEDAAVIEALQGSSSASSGSIVDEMDSAARELFDRGDVSVFLNADHLTEVYKAQLEKGADSFARSLTLQMSMVPGADVGSSVDESTNAGRQFLKDTRAFTSATVITSDGLNVETLAQFKPESPTAEAMDGHPGNALTTISRLPEGGVLYFGLSGTLSGGIQGKLQSSTSLAEPTDERRQQLEDLKVQLAEVTYQSFVAVLGLGHREEGIVRVASITEATPADKLRDFGEAAAELSTVELEGQGIKQEAEYVRDAETAGGHAVDVLTITTTVDPNVNPFFGSMLMRINSALWGPRGMEMRYAYSGDKVLFALGGGPEAMEAAVESADGSEPNGTETYRKGLLEAPNVLLLLDVQRIAYRALKAAAEQDLGLPIDEKILGSEEPSPSFIGFSVGTEPGALRSKSQLPSGQIYRITQLVIFARMARQ